MRSPFKFYLGTHLTNWLSDDRCRDIPLFVSRRRLCTVKKLKRAITSYALDSGGFTEIQMFGRWTLSPADYVAELRRYREKIGPFDWAAPQDWMCEKPVLQGLVLPRKLPSCATCKKTIPRGEPTPHMRTLSLDDDERPTFVCDCCGSTTVGKKPSIKIREWRTWAEQAGPNLVESIAKANEYGIDAVVAFHGTGLSIEEHQRRTVENFVELRHLAPNLPIIPVLQGWTLADYLRCVEMYAQAGVDLFAEFIVGVGTVCRRQGTKEATIILRTLANLGLRIHGFGFKMKGLEQVSDALASADSLAWSFAARKEPRLPGCTHKNCANCIHYALMWRTRLMDRLQHVHEQDESMCAMLLDDL